MRKSFLLIAAILPPILGWLWITYSLHITPVWDEQGFINRSHQYESFMVMLSDIWLNSHIYRPIPKSIIFPILSLIEDKDLAWRILRTLNTGLILAATFFYLGFIRNMLRIPPLSQGILVIVLLFSPAALIVATWGANMFDATALLFICVGLWLLSRLRYSDAALSFGLAFFCKETAVLVFPFLLYWVLIHPVPRRDLIRSGMIVSAFFAVYMGLRSRVIDLGSANDIHGFDWGLIASNLNSYINTMWWQIPAAPPYLGWGILLVFLCLLCRPKPIIALLLMLGSCVVIYLGMPYQGEVPLIAHTVFQPRLYLIPSFFLITILLIHIKPRWIVLLIFLPLHMAGTVWEYRYYSTFQQAYLKIEELSKQQSHVLTILTTARGVQNANWQNGTVAYRILHLEQVADSPIDYVLNAANGELIPFATMAMASARPAVEIQYPPPKAHALFGTIDTSTIKDNKLILRGWSPLHAFEKRKRLIISLPDPPSKQSYHVIKRDDVAKALKKTIMTYSGFRLELTFASKSQAEHSLHSLCLLAGSDSQPLTLLHSKNPACRQYLNQTPLAASINKD